MPRTRAQTSSLPPPPPPPAPSTARAGSGTKWLVGLFVGLSLLFVLLIVGGMAAAIIWADEWALDDEYEYVDDTLPPPNLAVRPQAIAGRWFCDTTGATYVLSVEDRQVRLDSLVDDDGEAYVVESCELEGNTVRWRYRVPSTSATVEEVVRFSAAENLEGDFTATFSDGRQARGNRAWTRYDDTPWSGAPRALAGTWSSYENDTSMVIEVRDDVVRLESVSIQYGSTACDDIQAHWDGRTLRWSYRDPESGAHFEHVTALMADDTLAGNYRLTDADGKVTTRSDYWYRDEP
jgi:hypothetical protein